MGSEMCIRDRPSVGVPALTSVKSLRARVAATPVRLEPSPTNYRAVTIPVKFALDKPTTS